MRASGPRTEGETCPTTAPAPRGSADAIAPASLRIVASYVAIIVLCIPQLGCARLRSARNRGTDPTTAPPPILGADESDLAKGSISVTSPLARSLIGKQVGDEVKVRMPGGDRTYEILDIAFG